MPKLTRDKYIVYIDASFGGETPQWFKIGKSLSSLATELNPDVSVEKNILGETFVTDNGYSPQTTVEPYYANTDDAIYEKILDIALNRKTGDACRTKIMEVVVSGSGDTGAAGRHRAWVEDVIVKPTSFGGDTSGVAIPFDVYFDGNRQEGDVDYAGDYRTSEPTFVDRTGA